jgi:alanine racemase
MRNAQLIIHVDHFIGNMAAVRKQVGRQVRLSASLKADAYGHGALRLARAAAEAGADFLGVASPEEAAGIRAAGLATPIILYGLCLPEKRALLAGLDTAAVAADAQSIEEFGRAAAGRRMRLHLKIDTGMGRIGCSIEEAPGLALMIARHPHLELAGIMTHFPSADEPGDAFTIAQIGRFEACLEAIRKTGVEPGLVHAANSGGILHYPQSWFSMVRPGILLYGYQPAPAAPRPFEVRPVMELKAPLVFIKRIAAGTPVSYGRSWAPDRDTCIGTIAAGYADGFPRSLSNRGRVLIRGRAYPVAGRVCMDQFMVDLGPRPEVERWDDATLFGPDPAGPDAWEVARLAGSIPYEITCGINRQARRTYAC